MHQHIQCVLRVTATAAWASGVAAAATMAGAQQPTAPQRPAVDVIVHDSLASRPLRAATVQLVLAADPVAFSSTGETDSLGRVTFRDIPAGRYSVGFMHPLLDSLGISAPVREVHVLTGRTARAELAVPSSSTLRAVFCGGHAGAVDDETSVIVGTIRDPRTMMPLAGAAVDAQWLEVTVAAGGIRQRVARATARSATNGWYSVCGAPSGTVTVGVVHAGDSTRGIDLKIEHGELRRRDLYVATHGLGQLRGRVIGFDSTARPLAGARVSVEGAGHAVTDAAGSWTIADVPLGTRMLEVRAIGYFPERKDVDVVSEMTAHEVTLTAVQPMLDAVRVTATREMSPDMGGFAARRRGSGMGRFVSADQVLKYNPVVTSDLLRMMPGFIGDGSLWMRGSFSDGQGNFNVKCIPEVYVDGQIMRGWVTSEMLNELVEPEDIAGIEVYSTGSPKPPQFDTGMSGCGALVIWQKPLIERIRRR